MVHIRRHALVRYSASQMFDLVNDIEAYPKRFPWCTGSRVVVNDAVSKTARLNLRMAGVSRSFTTHNQLTRPERIDIRLVEGPFRQLTGHWDFLALADQGCKVSLVLDFDFVSSLLGPLLQRGFQGIADHLVDDFCREAARVYG